MASALAPPPPQTPMGQPTIAHPSEVVLGTGAECDITIPGTFIGGHLGMGWGREGVLGPLYTTNIHMTKSLIWM